MWNQDKHDAVEGNDSSVFETQLFTMVSSVRERYGNMTVVARYFVRDWKQKNMECCRPIVENIQKVIKDLGNSASVNTDDLLSNQEKVGNNDDIHFCREGLWRLGERYFEKYNELKNERI